VVVNRPIDASPDKIMLALRYMLAIGDVSCRETEVDHVYLVRGLAETKTEVIGLDVAVDVAVAVQELETHDHLVHEHQDGLE
jgi:hypothetical protein